MNTSPPLLFLPPPLMPYGPPCGHTSIILGLSRQLFQGQQEKEQPDDEDNPNNLMEAISRSSPATVLLHGCTEYFRVLSRCLPGHGMTFVSECPAGVTLVEGRGETYLHDVISGFDSLSTSQESIFGAVESLDSAFRAAMASHPNKYSQSDECDDLAAMAAATAAAAAVTAPIPQEDPKAQPENDEELRPPPPTKRRGSKKKAFRRAPSQQQQQQQQRQRAVLKSVVIRGEEGSVPTSLRHRMILVLPLMQRIENESEIELHTLSDGTTVNVRDRFDKFISSCRLQKMSCVTAESYDFFVVRVNVGSTAQPVSVSSHRHHSVVNLSDFPLYMTDLSAQQCCLMKVVVRGINASLHDSTAPPAPDEGKAANRVMGTAVFWAEGFPEHVLTPPPAGTYTQKLQHTELTLFWKQPSDASLQVPPPDSLPCSCIHRATPAYSDDPVSQALWTHVLSGKSVLLGTGAGAFTHSLQAHPNGVVYMHCCRDVDLALADNIYSSNDNSDIGPSVFDLTGCKSCSSRDFFELMDSNLLCYKKSADVVEDLIPVQILGENSYALTPVLAERYTRFFPWTDRHSVVQGKDTYEELHNLLDQIRKVVTLPKIPPPAMALGRSSFERLAECATSNNQRLFPPLRSSVAARKKAYQKLCEEVYLLAKSCDTTPEHHTLVELLEKLIPPELFDHKKVTSAHTAFREHSDAKPDGKIPAVKEVPEKESKKRVADGDSDSLLAVFWDL